MKKISYGAFLWYGLFLCVCILGSITLVHAKEALPPAPQRYFNDNAGIVSPGVGAQLNQKLAAFDRATSTQIVVAIYPQFSSKTSVDDYAQQLYSAWHLGTKEKSNGVLLLIFPKEHFIRIQTGYGLEGALPDILCKHIIEEEMVPAFQKGKYDQGIVAGVGALMKAAAGEYQVKPHPKKKLSWPQILFSPLGLFLLIMIGSFVMNRKQQRFGSGSGGWFIGGGMGDSSHHGGDWGGFSGGGGDSGGGGAGGSW